MLNRKVQMKVEAVCTGDQCGTVIDLGNGTKFRHVLLAQCSRIEVGTGAALDDDGNVIECPTCGSKLEAKDLAREDALFAMGDRLVTPGVFALFESVDLYQKHIGRWLRSHGRCDYGSLPDEDRTVNTAALNIDRDGQAQGRIMSVFNYKGQPVWIITERGRHSTTVLLPDEY